MIVNDTDLSSKILLILNHAGPAQDDLKERLKVIGYTPEQVGYQCYLLNDGRFIKGVDVGCCGDGSIPSYSPLSLTLAGHDYIEKIKKDEHWVEKTKVFFRKLNINIFSININM